MHRTITPEKLSYYAYINIDAVKEPVRGVVVVCAGAEDPVVSERVRSVITTVFHISERRVCVVQQK